MGMYGRTLRAGIAEGEFQPLVEKMAAADFKSCARLSVTGHSLGGSCACLFAVLVNDTDDPLAFGAERKYVDALYAFGPPPAFHSALGYDRGDYGRGQLQAKAINGQRPSDGVFPGGIFRALRTVNSVEVQDRGFNLAVMDDFYYPRADLVSLRFGRRAPEVIAAEHVSRDALRGYPLDDVLFPLHYPMNYVNMLRG